MENKTKHIIKVTITNLCRFVLAISFVFSGFVKAIDPLGTAYKIEDYLAAFSLEAFFPSFAPLLLSVLLSILEFSVGMLLFFGIRKKLSSILALLLMLFMTPLTLYLALENPVSDCGCFGDALVLTNWETFYKNVVLLTAALTLNFWKLHIIRFFTERTQWFISAYITFFIFGLSVFCLKNLPILDFRPYYVGQNIAKGMEIPDDAVLPEYETKFVLEKDGVQKEFSLENYPDSTWQFISSKSVLVRKGFEPEIKDFTLIDNNGEDITSQILDDEYHFLLVTHRLDVAGENYVDVINDIYDYCLEHGYGFHALTSSNDDVILDWRDKTGAEYPFVKMDDIILKTIVRSNPGLLLLKKGTIINKWSESNLPDEYTLSDNLENLNIESKHGTQQDLLTLGKTLLWFLLPLFLFYISDVRYKRKNKM